MTGWGKSKHAGGYQRPMTDKEKRRAANKRRQAAVGSFEGVARSAASPLEFRAMTVDEVREAIVRGLAKARIDPDPVGDLHPASTSKPGGLVCSRCGRSDGTFEAWGDVVTHSPCDAG